MSQVYNLEPAPTAKVILQTTAGDILLELFGKQCPLATQNFLQHCLDNTYNNTIFHRLVLNFVLQGGDPTGTGSGGHSAINGNEPFQDEFHSRLKFNRRGLLGMANEGRDSNGSQFFFTLAATPELQGKHTMFGRVEGDTIYNLMKMADVEIVEGTERPLYPAKITGTEILVNPFEGMVARVREAPRVKGQEAPTGVKKRKNAGGGKNVLSFGGEDGDEENVAPVLKKAKANPKLVSVGVPEQSNNLNGATAPPASRKKQEKLRQRRTPTPSPVHSDDEETAPQRPVPIMKTNGRAPIRSSSPEAELSSKQISALKKTNAEIAALKVSMKRNVDSAPNSKEKPKNALEAMIPATSTRGRKRGKMTDEKGALDVFKAFKQRLEDIPTASASVDPVTKPEAIDNPAAKDKTETNGRPIAESLPDDDEAALCDLHFIANCQSCQSWDDEDSKPDREAEADGGDDAAWMSHQLTFAKDTLGKDLEWKRKMKEIEVIDPREKAREIKAEKREEKKKRERAK